jgi:hypothetical protein
LLNGKEGYKGGRGGHISARSAGLVVPAETVGRRRRGHI